MTSMNLSGVIDPSMIYDTKALKRQLGVNDGTLRSARRKGLKVHRMGRTNLYYGHDLVDYVLNKCSIVGADGELHAPTIAV